MVRRRIDIPEEPATEAAVDGTRTDDADDDEDTTAAVEVLFTLRRSIFLIS
jgi:hypothetical protein